MVIVAVPLGALASLRQPRLWRLPPSPQLTAVMGTLTFPPRKRSPVAVVGPLAGLPGMYEPSWGPPGKLASAIAEIAGALLAVAGLIWALVMRRREARPA